jgi:rare lipoprotein A
MTGASRGRRSAALALLAFGLLLPGCTPRPKPPEEASEVRYMVGAPYQLGGVWSYPREDFALRETGLATVAANRRSGRRTTDGEIFDPTALTAAHRTLQLPAIVTVTNLENGLELRVRVNDRGPAQPGRLLELSPRAAQLLRIPGGGGTQIAIAVDTEASQSLSGGLPQADAPALVIAAAPRGPVASESLAPLPGTRAAERVREGRAAPAFTTPTAAAVTVPERLPETLAQGFARPGSLMIQASTFTSRTDAQRQAARIGARVESFGPGRRPEYRVRLGPYNSVPQADAALEMARRAGVTEARILVD